MLLTHSSRCVWIRDNSCTRHIKRYIIGRSSVLASLPLGSHSYFSSATVLFSLIPLCFHWPPHTRATLQPEELTLLLIQLRRHQAKMAGAHSPSNAFAHLQHHQHNGLLGPSMQVRDPHTSPNAAPLHPVPVHCGPPAPIQPYPYITTLQYVIITDCAVCWFCLVSSLTILTCARLYLWLFVSASQAPLSWTRRSLVRFCLQWFATCEACCLRLYFFALLCFTDL